jgi:PAS domain S-box-containing protein
MCLASPGGAVKAPSTREVTQGGARCRSARVIPGEADETLARMREALHESEERFRLIVDGVRDYAIVVLGPAGQVVTWNSGAERLTGYRAAEAIGMNLSVLYPPEDAASCVRDLEETAREGRVEHEGWRVRKDGTRFFAHHVLTSLRDASGRLIGYAKVSRDLSERLTLRATEERFRLFVQNVRDYAILLLDPSGRVISWNPGAQRMKGYRAEEILDRHFSVFYPEEAVKNGVCDLELGVAAKEGRFEDEGWRVRKDGTRFWANVVITALRDAGGTLVGYAKITRDLSERRKAEEERIRLAQVEEANRVKDAFLEREKEARGAAEEAKNSLATMLRSIGDAVVATDEHGVVTLVNPVAEKLTGWTESEARGRPLRVIFHIVNEETRQLVESPVDRVLREGVVVGLANHTILIARDGTERPINDSGAPIRDDQNRIRGVILVFRDASTESKASARREFLAEATAVLTSSLDYRETLARVASLLVPRLADWCSVEILENPEGPFVNVGTAHVDPLKVELARELRRRFPPATDAPRGVANVVRSGRAELFPVITDDLLVGSARSDEELRMLRELKLRSAIIVPLASSGRVTGAVSLVFAESGRTYTKDDVAFAEELARRATTAIDNARLYAAEQRARDMADAASRAKDEFLASVSHELRTPLSAILGWSKMLSMPMLDDTKRARALETIERNAVAMAQLIEDLLDVSRIVSGKLRLDLGRVNVAAVIEAAIESVRPAADAKSIVIEQALDAEAGTINGDGARLQQVVWNLVNNAVKFTPSRGRVTVSLAGRDGHLEITVSDTGKGIEPRFLPHVFEPFRQADSTVTRGAGGLGLGLAIVKHLVELHGGHIQAESEGAGRGAVFTVRLPRPLRKAARGSEGMLAAPRPAPIAPLPQLAGLRVLVVEDDADMRHLIADLLTECGCDVTTTNSTAEALAVFQRGAPDVLLSDIAMQGQTGYDLIRAVRMLPPEKGGSVPAAALTAYTRAEDRRKILSAGFELHVPKPIEPAELVTVVATLAKFAGR